MKKSSHWLAAICLIGAIITIVLSLLWFNIVSMTAKMPNDNPAYTVEALALQITILEMFLAVFGIALGILAFFGYIGIKSAAEAKAQEVAEATAAERMSEFIKQQSQQSPGSIPSGKDVAPQAQAPKDAERATEE